MIESLFFRFIIAKVPKNLVDCLHSFLLIGQIKPKGMQIFDNILFDRYFFFSAEPRRIESAAVMDFFSAVARKMLGRAIIINLDNNEPAAATVVGTTSKGFPKRGRGHQRGRNLRGTHLAGGAGAGAASVPCGPTLNPATTTPTLIAGSLRLVDFCFSGVVLSKQMLKA